MHLESLSNIGPFGEFLAAFDRHGIGPHLDPLRIEPGLPIAHVELPTVPGTTQELADPRALVDTGLRRGQSRHAGSLVQRRALMRAAIEQRKELAVDVEHHDVAAIDADHLVAAGRDLAGASDDVTGHEANRLGLFGWTMPL